MWVGLARENAMRRARARCVDAARRVAAAVVVRKRWCRRCRWRQSRRRLCATVALRFRAGAGRVPRAARQDETGGGRGMCERGREQCKVPEAGVSPASQASLVRLSDRADKHRKSGFPFAVRQAASWIDNDGSDCFEFRDGRERKRWDGRARRDFYPGLISCQSLAASSAGSTMRLDSRLSSCYVLASTSVPASLQPVRDG